MALSRRFYERPALTVALDLLGCLLVHQTPAGTISGRIVEVEAYLGRDDPASHAFAGPKGRAQIFWRGAGVAYVYFIYGMHLCFNVTIRAGTEVGGVLVRALEPVSGVDLMQQTGVRQMMPARHAVQGASRALWASPSPITGWI